MFVFFGSGTFTFEIFVILAFMSSLLFVKCILYVHLFCVEIESLHGI